MEALHGAILWLNGIVWGPPMLILLFGTHLYLTFRLKFIQKYVFKAIKLSVTKDDSGTGDISQFGALATALAATIGTGNIVGVATAVSIGGPGAVLWTWLTGLFGIATKYSEGLLAVKYRVKTSDGTMLGGPMYALERGLNMKWLGVLFAIFTVVASFGIGNMTQANSVAMAVQESFKIPPLATGIALAVLTFLVIVGGIKRIGKITEKLVPFMSAIYILGGLFILFSNVGAIPGAFALIFSRAFTGTAAIGGFAGSTMAMAIRFGIARGVFTNEAGLGSAPIAHAAATTDHPVRQGLWGVFEVFMDTIVICSITALAIITTGVWETGETGAVLTTIAFNTAIPGGGLIVTIGIVLFAYSTILGWAYYGERCLEYLAGTKPILAYRLAWVVFVVIGAIGGLEFIWSLADTLNGLMAIPNLIGVLFLSGTVFKLTKEYFSKEKAK